MVTKKSSTTCFNIKLAWHEISRMYQSYTAEHGVSVSLAYVLLSLKKNEEIKSTQIAPMLGMEASSLTRIIKNLEEKKWIKKRPGKVDKREVFITLTELGAEKRELARKEVRKFNSKIRSELDEEELSNFMKTLDKINKISRENYLD